MHVFKDLCCCHILLIYCEPKSLNVCLEDTVLFIVFNRLSNVVPFLCSGSFTWENLFYTKISFPKNPQSTMVREIVFEQISCNPRMVTTEKSQEKLKIQRGRRSDENKLQQCDEEHLGTRGIWFSSGLMSFQSWRKLWRNWLQLQSVCNYG